MNIDNLKTHSIRKRFVKDYGLPIQVFQSPFFEYYLETLNKEYNIDQKLKEFSVILQHCGNENEFFVLSSNLTNKIVHEVSSSKEYKDFISMDMKKFLVSNNIKNSTLYQEKNINKYFISIDMKKANFQSLQKVNVIKDFLWDDFISKYTDFDYFKNSKYFRQVVLGKLNPKRQQSIQKYLINKVYNDIIEEYPFVSEFPIFSFTSDEIVFQIDKDFDQSIISKLFNENFFRIEKFKLKSLRDKKGNLFYIKESIDNIEFKKVPSHLFLQVFKQYKGLEITEYDRKFYFEGLISTFDESIF